MLHTVRSEKNTTNLSVTAKCLAIVLSDSATREIWTDSDLRTSLRNRSAVLNGKQLLDDFKLRNKTCYWNPALAESIKNLCYKGFVEPSTILVVGDEIHLENLRTAWGRRVLKAPFGFNIETIGDVSSIEMQMIPQTQFTPLPDALCLIVLELNNRCIVATLDTIKEQLLDCYREMTMPNDHLIFDTLGTLIQQRKIFHSGNGYFVVTPETYRCQTEKQSLSLNSSWLPYPPFYIPVFPQIQELPSQHRNKHCTPGTKFTRSISCQAGVSEQLKPFHDLCKTHNKKEIKSLPRCLSIRESRPQKGVKEQNKITRDGELKRSTSLKLKTKSNDIKDINLKKSNINKVREKGDKEKMSFFAKIFSRSKKKTNSARSPPSPVPSLKQVEYASFSAQFPPPEWQWYKQQVEKHRRTQEWVCNQDETASAQQCFRKSFPGTEPGLAVNLAPCELDRKVHTYTKDSIMHDKDNKCLKRQQEKRKEKTVCHLKPDKYSVPVIHRDFQDLPCPIPQSSENVYQMVFEHKDPRPGHSIPLLCESIPAFNDIDQIDCPKSLKPVSVQQHRTQKLRKNYKHRSVELSNQNDISFEYVGMLANKNSQYHHSRDSGVNFVGLQMTVQNNIPNDLKSLNHHRIPITMRNKFDTCKDENCMNVVPQCQMDNMSENHIEKDLALALSSKCCGEPDSVQVKSHREANHNSTSTKVRNSNSQLGRSEDDFFEDTYINDMPVARKGAMQNLSTKTSSVVYIDSNIKVVDSGFSSAHFREVKNIVSSKLHSQRNANCDDSDRHRTSKKKVYKSVSQHIASSGVQLAPQDQAIFHQKPSFCADRFGDSADYKVVGVL